MKTRTLKLVKSEEWDTRPISLRFERRKEDVSIEVSMEISNFEKCTNKMLGRLTTLINNSLKNVENPFANFSVKTFHQQGGHIEFMFYCSKRDTGSYSFQTQNPDLIAATIAEYFYQKRK